MTKRFAFVSPHPDDVEIGCGGIIHKIAKAGNHVTILVCTGVGDLKMRHSGETIPFERRMQEQRDAAAILGAEGIDFMDLAPAGKFDTVPLSNFVDAFNDRFRHFDQVYLPFPSYNQDHTVVWQAAQAAFRPGKLDNVGMYAYEQANGNAHGDTTEKRLGKIYVELEPADLKAKEKAIQAHMSQLNGRLLSIYGPAAAEALASLRGMETGVEYAEVIYLIRERWTV